MGKSIKVQDKTYEKLLEIKEDNGMKSVNAVVEKLVGEGNRANVEFSKEAPAFTLVGETNRQHGTDLIVDVSWDKLKKSDVGDSWVVDMDVTYERADVMFKDDEGVFIRFVHVNTNRLDEYCGEKQVSVQYFHFL